MNEPKSKAEIRRTRKANRKFLESIQSTEVPANGKQVIQFRFADGTTMHMSRDEYEMRLSEQRQELAEYETVTRPAVANYTWKERQRKRELAQLQHASTEQGLAEEPIKAAWVQWRNEKGPHTEKRWGAEFAREMLKKHPVFEDTRTISRWLTAWEKAIVAEQN